MLDFSGICVGLRKDDDALLEEVNEALAGISTEDRQALMEEVTEKAGEAK